MAQVTIYHNPRCSKSRQTLALLEDNNVEIEIVEYLKNPPSVEELKSVISKLGVTPKEIMRKKEDEYRESGLDNEDLTEEEQVKLMTQFPKVIERPIVVKNDRAVVGRPPENVLAFIE